jgi:hypothetical protein
MGELHERVPMSSDDLARWRRDNEWTLRWDPDRAPPTMKSVPNGLLRLSLPSRWRTKARSNWTEGPRGGLEGKLPGFFAELERRAEEDDHRAEERQRQAELRRQHELEQIERQRLQQIEQARLEQLTKEVASWRLADDVRTYVTAIRRRAEAENPANGAEILDWCDWALSWADRSDPELNLERLAGLGSDEQTA